MKMIYTAQDGPDAHLLCAHLESNGVRATVRGEPLAAAVGGIPIPTAVPTVWISDDEQEEAARGLIGQYEVLRRHQHAHRCKHCGYDLTGLTEPRCPECGQACERVGNVLAPGSWTCPTCGELIEGQFTACWKCAAAGAGD